MTDIETAARELAAATEALLDWMNGNDLSADHADQRPADYDRLCAALEQMHAVLDPPLAGMQRKAGG